MSEYRVEKREAEAELTLATGAAVKGCFFLSASSPSHAGPERLRDVLNAHSGFVPFKIENGLTALFNRAHIVLIRLPAQAIEAQFEPGYEVATRRVVSMLLSTGQRIAGTVSVYQPAGHDRLSDYASSSETFRYVETEHHTLIVNSAHMVELREAGD